MIKKLLTILLAGLFLFNCFGYKLVISYFENKADQQLESQLDNDNYDATQLVSIKVPITYLPYYNNSKTFERVDGQIEILGTLFKYVKRRIYNDSLELLCIPNSAAMRLNTAKNEIFRFVNDLQSGKKTESHSHSLKLPSVSDYIPNSLFQLGDLYCTAGINPFPYSSDVPEGNCMSEDHPPQQS